MGGGKHIQEDIQTLIKKIKIGISFMGKKQETDKKRKLRINWFAQLQVDRRLPAMQSDDSLVVPFFGEIVKLQPGG